MTLAAARGGNSSLYFAFGSNMNPSRMTDRGLRFVRAEGARLAGFELVFDKVSNAHPGVAHANIRRAAGSVVEGVVYQLHDDGEIARLDPFERTPINYSRELFELAADSGRCWAWTYVANPAVRRAGLLPEQAYLDHLLAGRGFLSPGYVAALECVRVR